MTARLNRRELGGLTVAAAVLAACGGSKSAPSAPTTTGGGSPLSDAAGSLPTAHISGTKVPVADQVSVADATVLADFVNGPWLGGWHDSTGAKGTADLIVKVDPQQRTLTFTASATGNLLGVPIRPETYVLDLRGFAREADEWTIQSAQVGKIVARPESGTSLTATTTNPPKTNVKSIDMNATRLGGRLDINYSLTMTSGHVVHGTMALAHGSVRATPAPIVTGSSAVSPSPANIESGAYAASLLTASQASKALGQPCAAPTANGGNVGYATGVQSTDALCASADKRISIQYTVFRALSPQIAKKFWKTQLRGFPTVRGPWKSGFWFTDVATFYAFTGREVITVNIVKLKGTNDAAAEQRESVAIAKDIARALGSP